ncbi:MAG: DUF4148 domain-containing protein [Betaproteobacteria bacterium]|nr:DUF4148 domain-containing protein [Betaproteobacteria bacterium]MDE2046813.1 DUF4148 domain-containing protein [Betaproteobacteria bacterium]
MNAKKLAVAALFAAAAATTFAGELNAWDNQPVQPAASDVSRAAVEADAVKAVQAGQVARGDIDQTVPVAVASRSRADVRAEAIAAARDTSLRSLYID